MSTSISDKIKNKLNIVDVISKYIDLQKKGKNYWGVCPFHEDTNPSMSVSSEKQMFKCFVCGTGGNAISFVADFEKITYGNALEKLAKTLGIEYKNSFDIQSNYSDKQQAIIDVLHDAMNYFEYALTTEEGKDAYQYAQKRKLNTKIREKFKIGYAPKAGLIKFLKNKGHEESIMINASLINNAGKEFFQNRLMFGISNEFGDVVGLSGRLLDKEGPKYINSIQSLVFEKSSILYNYNNAKQIIQRKKEIYILEGFMDVVAMDQAGFTNSVAIMGTALTKDHLKLLKNINVTLVLDSDAAGIQATLKSIALLVYYNVPNYVVYIKERKDADEVFQKKGKDELQKVIKDKISGLQFVYAILKDKHKTDTPNGINSFIIEISKYLANTNNLEKQFYINKMSQEFGITPELISSKIPGHTFKKVTLPSLSKNNKIKEKNINIKYPKINYPYVLIKAMIKKPFLTEILKENPAMFEDAILLGIAKYIVHLKDDVQKGNKPKKNNEFTKKIQEILNYRWEEINTKENFLDVIKLINKKSIDARETLLSVKLNSADSESEKEELLIKKWKMKKERAK